MAPTVCNKKEPRVRTGTVAALHDIKLLSNSPNGSASTNSGSIMSYAGKITHRRSVTGRNAKSKLSNRRLPDSESSSSDESEVETYVRMDDDDTFPMEEALSPAISDKNAEYAPSLAASDISAGCQCSDRLTVVTASTDSAYGSSRCRYCSSPNVPAPVDYVMNASPNVNISNDIVIFNRERINFSDDSASNYSTNSSAWDSDNNSSENFENRFYIRKKSHRNNRNLLEIAVKTVKLIKRNQLLQKKLAQLQFETSQFIQSVMANPENKSVHTQISTDERKEVEA